MTRTIRRSAVAAFAVLATITALTTTPAAAADTTPPSIVGSKNPAPDGDGWNNTTPVTVHFSCNDAESGVANCTADQAISDEGTTVVHGVATDNDGNVATADVTVKIDTEGPIVQLVGSGTQNKSGYYTGPVTVHATCFDALSGVDVCPSDVVVTAEGQTDVLMQATDNAGNTTDAHLVVTIDSTGPTITPTLVGTLGNNGWYTSNVTITYQCTDAGSGVRYCQSPDSVRSDGSVIRKAMAVDNLGRYTIIDVPVKVDKTKPAATIKSPARKGIAPGSLITGTASDGTSGVASATASFDGGAPVPVNLMCQGGGKACTWTVAGPAAPGTHTIRVTVTDKAGNTFTTLPTTFKTL